MKIPKRRESKIKNGVQKKPDKFMRVMFVFMALFFITAFICILKFNLENCKSDNTQKDTSNKQPGNSTHVDTTHIEIIERNKEDKLAYLFKSLYDKVDLNNDITFEDFYEVYKDRYQEEKKSRSPTPIKRAISMIAKHNKDLKTMFENFDESVEKYLGLVGTFESLSNPKSDRSLLLYSMYRSLYFLYVIVENVIEINNGTNVHIGDHEEQKELQIYLNYLLIYLGIHRTFTVLETALNKKHTFGFFENELFQNKEVKEFGLKYKNALISLSENIFTEKMINIGIFKDEANDEGTEILQIEDCQRFKLFIQFTFIQIFLNIFEFHKNNEKSMLKSDMVEYVKKYLLQGDDEETDNNLVNKVEKECSTIFLFFEDSDVKYRENWINQFKNCLEKIMDLDSEVKIRIHR
eukprot:GAHX01001409.1.p1 GENE.GAHX01001409.1~~GAHX01001409.1.p1  ORF type:complete len:407 (-),score=74.40 GAHX01001409.1:1136-2356(-)